VFRFKNFQNGVSKCKVYFFVHHVSIYLVDHRFFILGINCGAIENTSHDDIVVCFIFNDNCLAPFCSGGKWVWLKKGLPNCKNWKFCMSFHSLILFLYVRCADRVSLSKLMLQVQYHRENNSFIKSSIKLTFE
jgi:hypothetical protein